MTPGSPQDFQQNVGDRVFFDTDRYDLSAEAQSQLQKQAAWLAQYPSVTVTVEGHADERGTREYNLALGERRANAVANYLTALGVDAGRLSVISYGKEASGLQRLERRLLGAEPPRRDCSERLIGGRRRASRRGSGSSASALRSLTRHRPPPGRSATGTG